MVFIKHVAILGGFKMNKIIFFDVDGTLFTPEIGYVTDRVKQAIKNIRKQGYLCFIASGRPYGFIADNIKEIGFDGYVLANGSNIKYQERDVMIRPLNTQHVRTLVKQLKERNIEYVLQTPTYCYIDEKNERLLSFYKKCNIDFKNFCFEFDEDDILDKVIKIEAWANDSQELTYICSHLDAFSYELHPDQHSMEIYSTTISKATGILDVLDLLNIPVEKSYCFGDGPNDVEMFETVGHPIAMGNAIDVIKQKAQEICPSVIEDGVAVKLESMIKV